MVFDDGFLENYLQDFENKLICEGYFNHFFDGLNSASGIMIKFVGVDINDAHFTFQIGFGLGHMPAVNIKKIHSNSSADVRIKAFQMLF